MGLENGSGDREAELYRQGQGHWHDAYQVRVLKVQSTCEEKHDACDGSGSKKPRNDGPTRLGSARSPACDFVGDGRGGGDVSSDDDRWCSQRI